MKEQHTLTDSLSRQEKENSKLGERVQEAETELLSLRSSTKNTKTGDFTLEPDVDIMQVSILLSSIPPCCFLFCLGIGFSKGSVG